MHAWGRQWMNEADATACERPQDQNRQSLQQYLLHVSPPGAYQLPLTNDCCAGSPERSRGDASKLEPRGPRLLKARSAFRARRLAVARIFLRSGACRSGGAIAGPSRGRQDEADRHQNPEHRICNHEGPWWEIVVNQPVDPIADEIARVAGLATHRTQLALESRQRTCGSHQRLSAYEGDRSQMRHAKPESSYPFPAHRDSGSNQRKPDRDECKVGGVEHRHSVCEQQVAIHLAHSS